MITAITARLDPAKLGLTVQAFIQVEMAIHSKSAARGFHALVHSLPEVVSCWTMTGEADYLLRVFCPNLAALNSLVHDLLLPHEAVQRVQTRAQPQRLGVGRRHRHHAVAARPVDVLN